jgi:hypothetical protein
MGDDSDCRYLLRETLAWRESLDLSKDSPMRVTVSWQCAHPFHGLRLDLGDDLAEVRRRCAGSGKPGAAAQGERRRDDVAGGDAVEEPGAV